MGDYNSSSDLARVIGELQRKITDMERLDLRAAAARAPWVVIALNSGFTDTASNYGGPPLSCYRNNVGHVYLRGTFRTPGAGAQSVGFLPVGYRPPYRQFFTAAFLTGAGTDRSDIWVESDGELRLGTIASGSADLSVDQISFRTL